MVTKLKFRILSLRKKWRAIMVEGEVSKRNQKIAVQKSGSDASERHDSQPDSCNLTHADKSHPTDDDISRKILSRRNLFPHV
jgi:hypothetical protein